MFDDSPVTIFAIAAGLIVHFELLSAIPDVWAISEKDEKHSWVVRPGVTRQPKQRFVTFCKELSQLKPTTSQSKRLLMASAILI